MLSGYIKEHRKKKQQIHKHEGKQKDCKKNEIVVYHRVFGEVEYFLEE